MARHCEQEFRQIQLLSTNDLEIFLALWCHILQQEGIPLHKKITFEDAIRATKHIFSKVDGAYAVVGIMAQAGMFAFSRPKGDSSFGLGKKRAVKRRYILHCFGDCCITLWDTKLCVTLPQVN